MVGSIDKVNAKDQVRPLFDFDNSFARSLEGFFVLCQAETAVAPKLLKLNKSLAEELGLNPVALDSETGLDVFSGNVVPQGSKPLAQAYAGHQFGGFVPQLGDGRALLLGEIINIQNQRRDIQLKGSGRTPFSRGGDGKAALGPVLREYLISEAIHALGIPTTRALAAVATGDAVYREVPLPGAILTRIASSHIRIGTFEFASARNQFEQVRKLADYAIARHYPDLSEAKNPYLEFFGAVADAQAFLIASWMHVGFIHGVMNTDNMTISGETIDFGPCAFMDRYAPETVFSSIDRQGRYAYGNQPSILLWNLMRLAETLIPIIDPDKNRAINLVTNKIDSIKILYETYWLKGMRSKIGLSTENSHDQDLVNDLLWVMKEGKADFTLVFRRLSMAVRGDSEPVRRLFDQSGAFDIWARRWRKRLEQDRIDPEDRARAMDLINPVYIPRNHKVEEVLASAVSQDDMTPFSKLLDVLCHPFDEISGNESYSLPAPVTGTPYRTFCGT